MKDSERLTPEEVDDLLKRVQKDLDILLQNELAKRDGDSAGVDKSMFVENKLYSRKEIHDLVGGGTEDYLPHNDYVVVCACFRLDLNPDAPEVVLVGDGKDIIRWANVFRRQMNFVPTFIKRADKEWEYVGNYKVKSSEDDLEIIEKYAAKAERTDVVRVLFLQKSE